MEHEAAFISYEGLCNFFQKSVTDANRGHKMATKRITSGVYVTSSLRSEVMTNVNQNKMTADGTVYNFVWVNMGGGVWCCNIDYRIQTVTEK